MAITLVLASAVSLSPQPGRAEALCFRESGFCLDNPQFEDYFRARGGLSTFGYPISREFVLQGFAVQFFQQLIMQLQPDGRVGLLNLLQEDLMPVTHAHTLTLPPADYELLRDAPQVDEEEYATQIVDFNGRSVVDEWQGQLVGFAQRFNDTPSSDVSLHAVAGQTSLVPLVELEIWGAITSPPTRDQNHTNLIYQRFQRSILQFDTNCHCTARLMVGEWFKEVITGDNLPDDLRSDMQKSPKGSRFLDQYDRSTANGPLRAAELRATDMHWAFSSELTEDMTPIAGPPTPPGTPIPTDTVNAAVSPTPTSTRTTTPTGTPSPIPTATLAPISPAVGGPTPAQIPTPTDSANPAVSPRPTSTRTTTPTGTPSPIPTATLAPTSTPVVLLDTPNARSAVDNPGSPGLWERTILLLALIMIGLPGVGSLVTRFRA